VIVQSFNHLSPQLSIANGPLTIGYPLPPSPPTLPPIIVEALPLPSPHYHHDVPPCCHLPGDTISFGRRVLQSREVLGVTYVVQYKETETEGQQQARGKEGSSSSSSGEEKGRPSKRRRVEAQAAEEAVSGNN